MWEKEIRIKRPGPVKHQDFPLTMEVGIPLWILVPWKAWVGLLEVEVARQVVEEARMLPAEKSQPILVTHVALVLEEEGLDQLFHSSNFDCRGKSSACSLSAQVVQDNSSVQTLEVKSFRKSLST